MSDTVAYGQVSRTPGHTQPHVSFRNFGLTLVVGVVFIVCWAGQTVAGWMVFNDDRLSNHQPPLPLLRYLATGHFWEATAENWESEFLQMGAFIVLTGLLFQKGSEESNDPDAVQGEPPIREDSPWPARRGGWVRAVYSYSLSIAFGVMFVVSVMLHIIAGAAEFNREQMGKGQATVTITGFALSPQFWFESLQNWQSEFLAIGMMVVLTIFLRHKGSPESKSVATPIWEHDA